MFNKIIFKHTLKSNFKIWFIITVVLCIMNVTLISVFDPKTISTMAEMAKDTPLATMLGATSFMGMLSQTFYTLQGIVLPILYIVIASNSLIVSQVDKGSMAYLLSTPVKRKEIVGTQIIYLITSLFIMILLTTLCGLVSIEAFQSSIDINVYDYLTVNFGLFLLMLAISSISFIFSCICNLSKNHMILGGGIPVAFFLLDMMANVSENLEPLKYFTLNTLFDADAILKGGDYMLQFIILLVISIVIYILAIGIFKEKDLPL